MENRCKFGMSGECELYGKLLPVYNKGQEYLIPLLNPEYVEHVCDSNNDDCPKRKSLELALDKKAEQIVAIVTKNRKISNLEASSPFGFS
jgi:hypothetical protein